MGEKYAKLSSLEIRNLLLDTLAYEDEDIDSEGKTFKKYGYQGTQSDLYRLVENLAIKEGMIPCEIKVPGAAWGGSGIMLHPRFTTNFSQSDIINIYEQFHLLLNQGIIAPGAIGNLGPNLPCFHVTEYGKQCLKEKEILPYDVDGYLKRIKDIPGITEWVEFYIQEALQCFNANCLEAAVIMLGLSSETIINEQLISLADYLKRYHSVEFEQMLVDRMKVKNASDKYNVFDKYFGLLKQKVSDQDFKKITLQIDKVAQKVYLNFTRITRNGLAHPSDTRMDRIEVLMVFISFIKYCETQYALIDYFISH